MRLSSHLVPWHNALVMHLLLVTALRQISIVQSFGFCTKNPEEDKMQADDVASRRYGSGMSIEPSNDVLGELSCSAERYLLCGRGSAAFAYFVAMF